jgi:recombinase
VGARVLTRFALAHKRATGGKLGAPPLGLRLPALASPQIPPELEAVRLILRRRRSGRTFRALAAELTAAGHRTKRGGTWCASTIRAVWERRAAYRPILDVSVANQARRLG